VRSGDYEHCKRVHRQYERQHRQYHVVPRHQVDLTRSAGRTVAGL